jgi:hypothetical protein
VRATPGWLRRAAAVSGAWLTVFTVLYLTVYRPITDNPYLTRYWEAAFLEPTAPDIARRALQSAADAFVAPILDAPPGALAALAGTALFLFGILATLRRSGRAPALLIATPYLCVLVASALGVYPAMGRLLLFLSPFCLMSAAAALTFLSELLPRPVRGLAYVGLVLLVLNGPGRSALWQARHPPRFEDSRPLVEELHRDSDGEAVYVLSRGVPAWIFYSTIWSAPDTARLRRMARIASSTGPAFENAPSRGRRVQDEADHLVYQYRGRREVIGIGSGMEFRAGRKYLQLVPDTGWGDNEVRRIRDAGSVAWIFASHHAQAEVDELLAAVQRAGGELVESRKRNGAALFRVRFTTPAPTQAAAERAGDSMIMARVR